MQPMRLLILKKMKGLDLDLANQLQFNYINDEKNKIGIRGI